MVYVTTYEVYGETCVVYDENYEFYGKTCVVSYILRELRVLRQDLRGQR